MLIGGANFDVPILNPLELLVSEIRQLEKKEVQ